MIGYITGSGFYDMPGFVGETVENRFGQVRLLRGSAGGRPTVLLPRHGTGHRNLPHHINHRANLLALKEAGVTAVVSCSVCGVVNPGWAPGGPFLADDLFFPDNRLGDGTVCSVFTEAGEPGRGHLLAASFFNDALNGRIRAALAAAGNGPKTGCYAHVPGPRFNAKAEIRALRAAGVDFLSQTCGPEAVLANELELPYALAGFGVDYANGVSAEPTPVETLTENLERAKSCFESLIGALSVAGGSVPSFENFVYRF